MNDILTVCPFTEDYTGDWFTLLMVYNDECPSAINVHWEAHGRYNEPLVSKSNAFLDFVQLAGQLHKCRASISGVPTQNCQLQHINWIN